MIAFIGKFRNHYTTDHDWTQTLVNIFWNSWYPKLSRITYIKTSRADAYSAHITMAEFNYKILKQYIHDSIDFGYKDIDNSSVVGDTGEERWKIALDKMVWSFEQIMNDDWEEQFFNSENDSFDMKSRDFFAQRIQEGLYLYSKYFMGIWW